MIDVSLLYEYRYRESKIPVKGNYSAVSILSSYFDGLCIYIHGALKIFRYNDTSG